jgi:hypothetical protein
VSAAGDFEDLFGQSVFPTDDVEDGVPRFGRDGADRKPVFVIHPDDVFGPGGWIILSVAQSVVRLVDPSIGDGVVEAVMDDEISVRHEAINLFLRQYTETVHVAFLLKW